MTCFSRDAAVRRLALTAALVVGPGGCTLLLADVSGAPDGGDAVHIEAASSGGSSSATDAKDASSSRDATKDGGRPDATSHPDAVSEGGLGDASLDHASLDHASPDSPPSSFCASLRDVDAGLIACADFDESATLPDGGVGGFQITVPSAMFVESSSYVSPPHGLDMTGTSAYLSAPIGPDAGSVTIEVDVNASSLPLPYYNPFIRYYSADTVGAAHDQFQLALVFTANDAGAPTGLQLDELDSVDGSSPTYQYGIAAGPGWLHATLTISRIDGGYGEQVTLNDASTPASVERLAHFINAGGTVAVGLAPGFEGKGAAVFDNVAVFAR